MKNIVTIFALTLVLASCKNTNEAGVASDDKMELDSIKQAMVRQKTIDSMQAVADARVQNSRPVIINNTPANAAAVAPTAQQERKGWSGAAKGAVIGAGVGAVSGALIDKKKSGRGAVIGGLAGAGLGAGTGAIIDSEKKKKEAQQ